MKGDSLAVSLYNRARMMKEADLVRLVAIEARQMSTSARVCSH